MLHHFPRSEARVTSPHRNHPGPPVLVEKIILAGMPSNEYMRVYMKRRYDERRALMIERLGGKCVVCGSKENLEMDHKDRTQRAANFDEIRGRSLAYFLQEVDKCQLLCEEHHIGKTLEERGQRRVTHGDLGMYQHHGCRCEACTTAMREYTRSYRAEKRISLLGHG